MEPSTPGSKPGRWLRLGPTPAETRYRLFCLPYAGGGASIFRQWPRSAPPWLQVCPVQLPGREDRFGEPAHDDVGALIQALGPVIAALGDRPFALFGHSMGALIAFELTRALRRLGHAGPAHLFVAGRNAPRVPDMSPPIHDLPGPAFIERLRSLGGTPEGVFESAELMALISPLLRADFALNERYRYTEDAPLDCALTVFGSREDDMVSHQGLLAWRDETTGPCELVMLPGGHFFVHDQHEAILGHIAHELAAG